MFPLVCDQCVTGKRSREQADPSTKKKDMYSRFLDLFFKDWPFSAGERYSKILSRAVAAVIVRICVSMYGESVPLVCL